LHWVYRFYSTIPASSLTQKLERLKTNTAWFDFQIFDREKIESILLRTGLGQGIAQRYFRNSYVEWNDQNVNIDLALARIGMPQPVSFRRTGDDRLLTLEEALKLYPQGNRYIWNPWLPGNLILCNNILGITKLIESGDLVDPPFDYFQKMNESIAANIEALRGHIGSNQPHVINRAESNEAINRREKNKSAKRRMAKQSRRRNRRPS
jgi:hypothetical protein